MKIKIISKVFFVFLLFVLTGTASAADLSIPNYDALNSSIMRPDRETLLQWIWDYENAPKAPINRKIQMQLSDAEAKDFGTSMNLLDHLDYTPSQRNQGSCGNCWVWAATGILEVAHSVQDGINDRLSIQYLNSCKSGSYACCGGNLTGFVNWYSGEGLTVPWSNTNASYADGSRQCGNNASYVSCGSISTNPNYAVTSIQEQVISTTGETQANAINNIKNILNQNKAVWFGFYLANQTDWNAFFSFWDSQNENAIWDPDPYCGHTWSNSSGGGHAVLIVGYNDDDSNPANHYWIVLNSWGTAGGSRPNGLFHMKMQMNYSCTLYDTPSFYSREFETINVDFGNSEPPTTFNASGRVTTSGGTGIFTTTMTFSIVSGTGAIPAAVQTDASGYWSQTGFESGTTYRVTPTKIGYTFSLSSLSFGSSASTSLNFTGTATTTGFNASGRITTGAGAGITDVTVTFTRIYGTGATPASVQTDASGKWAQTGFQSKTWYRVTPSKSDSTFSPSFRYFNNASTTLNFTGTASTGDFSVSGKAALRTGTVISDVTMTFTKISGTGVIPASVKTDASGNWSQTGFQSGTTYRVTPSKTGKYFYPSSLSFSSASTSLNFLSFW